MKKTLFILIFGCFILLSCNSTKTDSEKKTFDNKLKFEYNQEKNITNIYNNYYVEKISLNGKWELALDYIIKNKIKSHQTYLINKDTIIGLLIHSESDGNILKTTNSILLSRYIKQHIDGWNYSKVKYESLKTDNKTFSVFRLIEKNKSSIHLIGYRNELKYHISISEPTTINDFEKTNFLINFYKTLTP